MYYSGYSPIGDQKELQDLIHYVIENKEASLYAEKWKGSKLVFDELPCVTVSDLINSPIEARTYVRGNNVAKIVHAYASPFIIEWNTDSLCSEQYGDPQSKRPLVLLHDGYEALEKSVWFYVHGILPLLGEAKNLPVAAYAAAAYQIDALVTDESTIRAFAPLLAKQHALKDIHSFTLMGSSFDGAILPFVLERFADCRLLLTLSEVGSIAESCPESLHVGVPIFHPVENCIIEFSDKRLIVTKIVLLPTPIIKYVTSLDGESVTTKCSCGTSMSFVLTRTRPTASVF